MIPRKIWAAEDFRDVSACNHLGRLAHFDKMPDDSTEVANTICIQSALAKLIYDAQRPADQINFIFEPSLLSWPETWQQKQACLLERLHIILQKDIEIVHKVRISTQSQFAMRVCYNTTMFKITS